MSDSGAVGNNPKPSTFCTTCPRIKEAESFCVTCCGYLCDKCDFSHKMMKCFIMHKVVSLKDLEVIKRDIPEENAGLEDSNKQFSFENIVKQLERNLKDYSFFTPSVQNSRDNKSYLTPPVSGQNEKFPNGAFLSSMNNDVKPYKPLIPVIPFEPTISTINPDLSLSVSDPDSIPNNTNLVHSMQVYKMFGLKGNELAQFHAPHGFCIGFDEDIVIADTSNHRIQVFDKHGFFKHHFGIAGRHDGYLWHPRKVAVLKFQRRYVICDRGNERSRLQFFSVEGKFIKKLNIPYVDILAAIAVTDDESIVIVDSVTPTVFIIGYNDFLRTIDCKSFMEEPSDVAAHGKELYICDFKGHSIAVIDLEGNLLRRFGCKETTIFPNGIDISANGEVCTCHSHGNFLHIVVPSKEGTFKAEFRCRRMKVSRCCGLKITCDGRLVTVDQKYHRIIILDTLRVSSSDY